jgi:small-conductance mechanosensitive channel
MIAYAAATTGTQIADNTTSQLTGIVAMIVTSIPLWIAAFVVILVTFLIAKIVKSVVESKMMEKGVEDDNKEVVALGGRVAYSAVLTIGVTVGLKIAGIDLTVIIAAVGFGLGFALQDLIMNFIAGIMLLLNRQFAIGDFINVGGTLGKVVEIQSRVTILRAVDGTKVIVPNSDLFSTQVTSYTSNPFRKIEVAAAVDYRGDLQNALKVCMHAVKQTKGILAEPKPAVVISGFGASNIDIKIGAWVESKSAWVKIKSNLMINIKKEYDKYGIPLAWSISQVMYDKDMPIDEKKFIEEKKLEAAIVADAAAQAQLQTPVTTQVQVTSVTPMTPVKQEAEYEEPQPLKPLGEIR